MRPWEPVRIATRVQHQAEVLGDRVGLAVRNRGTEAIDFGHLFLVLRASRRQFRVVAGPQATQLSPTLRLAIAMVGQRCRMPDARRVDCLVVTSPGPRDYGLQSLRSGRQHELRLSKRLQKATVVKRRRRPRRHQREKIDVIVDRQRCVQQPSEVVEPFCQFGVQPVDLLLTRLRVDALGLALGLRRAAGRLTLALLLLANRGAPGALRLRALALHVPLKLSEEPATSCHPRILFRLGRLRNTGVVLERTAGTDVCLPARASSADQSSRRPSSRSGTSTANASRSALIRGVEDKLASREILLQVWNGSGPWNGEHHGAVREQPRASPLRGVADEPAQGMRVRRQRPRGAERLVEPHVAAADGRLRCDRRAGRSRPGSSTPRDGRRCPAGA